MKISLDEDIRGDPFPCIPGSDFFHVEPDQCSDFMIWNGINEVRFPAPINPIRNRPFGNVDHPAECFD